MGATARKRAQDLTATGWDQGSDFALLADMVDVVNELQAYAAGIKAANNLQMNQALGATGLAIGGTTTAYKHTTAVNFVSGGVLKLSATTADHAFTGTEVITQNLWGGFLITLTGTTWKSTPFSATPMAYASEALAIAAMLTMTLPANEAVMGYITIRARSTVDFTAGTTTLTADNGSGNSQTVNYVDGGFTKLPGMAAVTALVSTTPLALTKN